ncbi:MAG: hypothetical protein E5W56_10460 [Mesorhizobium sp.]|nr:MAG: hypothetical protein E5W57_20440 [Mesorhizobium sp.]TIT80298.1 MAG: hypothetical protein E5W56_10460 [Mesorhizobium sp.]
MYWWIRENAREYCILADDGNVAGPQQFLEMEKGAAQVDRDTLQFRFDDERPLPIPDFVPSSHPGVIFAKPEVFSLFDHLLVENHHKSYVARTDRGPLQIYAPMEEVSGFDFSRSTFDTFDDGDIWHIYELRLVDGFSTNSHLFRLNDNWGTRFHIVVSDAFKDVYEKHGLTGLRFHPT